MVAVVVLMALGSIPTGLAGRPTPAATPLAPGTPSPPQSSSIGNPLASNSSGWQLVNTTGGPSARAGFGMAYDAAMGAIVMFGGCTSGQYWNYSCDVTNQTWSFSNGNWTQLDPTLSPSGRVNPAMAYDPETGDILLFGGGSGTPYYLSYNDTWQFNGTSWSQLSTNLTPPPSDFGAVMAYDSAVGGIVMFDSGEVYHGGPFLNDVWVFAGGQWSLASHGTGPSPRSAVSFTYDPGLGAAVLFGGNQCQNATGLCPNLGDTWTYASGTWTNVSNGSLPSPSPRNGAEFAYDPALNASLLFSGHDGFAYYNDSWTYSAGGWTELSSTSVGPAAADGAGLVYDSATRQMVFFGGYDADDTQFNGSQFFFDQTWTLSGVPTPVAQPWSPVNSTGTPSARAGFGMVYDPAIGAVVMFGGCTSGHYWNYSCNATNETWTYAHGVWTQLAPAVSPSARVQPAMTYDPATGDVLLFGGASGDPSYLVYNDTWEFNGTAWTQLAPTLSPAASGFGAVMAYDNSTGSVVLFDSGEQYAGGPYLNNTYTFSGGQWTWAAAGLGPSPRSGESLTYDPAIGGLLLFGGNQCQNTTGLCPNLGDTWAYVNGSWSNLTVVGPEPRNQAMLAYDPTLNAAVLFGGHDALTYYGDTWTYTAAGWSLLAPTSSAGPSLSEGAGLVYDAADQQLLLFGGYENIGGSYLSNGTEVYYNQLWGLPTAQTSPGLAITSFLANPSLITLGNTTVLSAFVQSTSPVTFSYTGLPTGCSSQNASLLDCTPTAVGNYTVTLTVANTQNLSAGATIPISVAADSSVGNGTPILLILALEASVTSVTVGNTTLITAEVVSTTPVTFHYSGLPTGCESANTDLLRCTPSAPGQFDVHLTVTDTRGLSAQAVVSITVVAVTSGIHTPTSPAGQGGLYANAGEYLVLGAIAGGVLLGAIAIGAVALQARYRREGEALAREMASYPEGDDELPRP